MVIICLYSDEMSSEVSAHKIKNNHKLKLKINIKPTVLNIFSLNTTQNI